MTDVWQWQVSKITVCQQVESTFVFGSVFKTAAEVIMSNCLDGGSKGAAQHRATSIKQNTVQLCLASTSHDGGDEFTFLL